MTTTPLAQIEWQSDYDSAVELGNAPPGYGKVADYYGQIDRMGGVALIIEFEDGRTLSPYYNQSAFDDPDGDSDGEQVENDAHEWADNMSGATQWRDWQWSAEIV